MLATTSGVVAASAPPTKAPPLMVVATIEPGQWELREIDAATPPRLICIADPDMLIQLRHAGAQCTRFVVENLPATATVSYSCSSAGTGRTTISLDTPRQFRLQTQGVAHSAPFDLDYAGRRVGSCVAAH